MFAHCRKRNVLSYRSKSERDFRILKAFHAGSRPAFSSSEIQLKTPITLRIKQRIFLCFSFGRRKFFKRFPLLRPAIIAHANNKFSHFLIHDFDANPTLCARVENFAIVTVYIRIRKYAACNFDLSLKNATLSWSIVRVRNICYFK